MSEDEFQIEIALAGFKQSDINIEIKDNVLSVDGSNIDDTREYLHHGIAGRAFTRTFTLADTVEVIDADMINGILVIRLKNIIPEHKKPRKLMIGQTQLPKDVNLIE
jgi:molecular chaperone IbpA